MAWASCGEAGAQTRSASSGASHREQARLRASSTCWTGTSISSLVGHQAISPACTFFCYLIIPSCYQPSKTTCALYDKLLHLVPWHPVRYDGSLALLSRREAAIATGLMLQGSWEVHNIGGPISAAADPAAGNSRRGSAVRRGSVRPWLEATGNQVAPLTHLQ